MNLKTAVEVKATPELRAAVKSNIVVFAIV